MRIKLFRCSEEGFKNYSQKHINYIQVEGCYCFVGKIIEDGLQYSNSYKDKAKSLRLKDRQKEKVNEMIVDDRTLVYARNFKIDGFDVEKYSVDFKRKRINNNLEDNQFVLISLKEVVERIDYFEKALESLEELNLGFSGICDWEVYEIILDLNKIVK